MDEAERNSADYIVTEELLDPVQDRRKFIIQRPSYRVFDPKENTVIKNIRTTLDETKRAKRHMISDDASSSESSETLFDTRKHDGSLNHEGIIQPLGPFSEFPVPKSFEAEDSSENNQNPLLKAVADAIEKSDTFGESSSFEEGAESEHSVAFEEDSSPEVIANSRKNFNLENELKEFEASKLQESFEESEEDFDDEEDDGEDDEEYEPVLIIPELPRNGKKLGEILGIPESKGPIMIEPESFYGPRLMDESDSYEDYGPYEVPQKVVIETNQKMTVIYDDESGSEEGDDSDSSEPEEKITHEEVLQVESGKPPVTMDSEKSENTLDLESQDEAPEVVEKTEHIPPPGSEFEEASKLFSKNLIMTLSVSPKMLIILAGILIIVFIFKMFFMWYSPQRFENGIKEIKETQEGPVSVITVDKTPLP